MTIKKEKSLIDAENQGVRPKFEHEKNYRYTWPGKSPKIVSGKELTLLCRGADPSMLAIEEVQPEPEPETKPEIETKSDPVESVAKV